MAKVGQPYTSGRWVVRAGREEAFIAEWTEFTDWSLSSIEGAESFVLIRNADDPRCFLSFGAWSDSDAVQTWRQHPEFTERLGRCRAMCEEFRAHDYTLAASPGVRA